MNPRATTERDRLPDTTRALTEREVAELLGLSVATLRAWRHRGKGPRFLRLGRSVRYLPADVATSFGRALLTRRRFPRQMVIRSSGSCRV